MASQNAGSEYEQLLCANCGKDIKDADSIIVANSNYDGEWVCSENCEYQHDALGCPFELSETYRVVSGHNEGG